jgi:hypothetical protein
MNAARHAARRVLGIVDRLYRRWHGLAPVGPLLFVGRTRYQGPARRFDDGTELRTGDPLGTLHFDNSSIAALDGAAPGATGLRFRRGLFASLRELAELSQPDRPLGDLVAYRGIGWVRHGEKIGFVHEPAGGGWRSRWVALHVRLLVWAFAAPGGTAMQARPELTVSWLTRRALDRFAHGDRP